MATSPHYPYLHIHYSVRDQAETVWAYIDTGFDGYLIIPDQLVEHLGSGDHLARWELGDGSLAIGDEYLGYAQLMDFPERMPVRITCLGNEYLVGRGIIDQWRVTLEHGQTVHIDP